MVDVEISKISIAGKEFLGVKVNLQNAPLLLLKGEKGFAMCGYLNPQTAEKLGDVAVIVSGVKDFDDMLDAPIKWVSPKAKDLGIKIGDVLKDELGNL